MALTFHVRSSALPSNAAVVAFRGSEGISRPYAFDIYVSVPGVEEVDLDDAPGARVSFQINEDANPPVVFEGMVATLELVRAVADNALYLVRLVPNLWQLSLTKHSRIFTKQSVPDVIKMVLQEEGVDNFDLRLKKTYDTEEQITQYKESSLNFIHRWMEREGMYYYFEQSDNGEKLVITDHLSTAQLSRLLPVPYHPADNDHSAGPHFNHFTARHSSLPATVRFTDYDYNKPQLNVAGSSAVSRSGVGEQVTYGNRFFTPDRGNSLAQIRAEDLRAQAKSYHAVGHVTSITSGYQFTLEHHPKLQLNVLYLAVSVDHFGHVAQAVGSWGKSIPAELHDDTYRVEVHAINAEQQYRHPELAPWPRLDGYENAIVDGAATSDYAQIDEHGRYAIKFKFDEGSLKDGKASTFVRKMQPHAGTVEGWHFPERKGTEVICAFMGGDPDRPVIVGAIPTATTPSPVTSSNHTQNVIQTGGFNRLELEDLSGQQRVTLSTPHSNTHLLMGNPREGHELIAKTDANALLHSGVTTDFRIGNLWTIDVGSHKTENVGATFTQTVQSSVSQTFNDTHTVNVTADVNFNHLAQFIHKVSADVIHNYMANHMQTIAGNVEKLIGGNHNATITADDIEKIGGSKIRQIAGEVVEQHDASERHTVGGFTDWSFQASKSETVYGVTMNKFLGLKDEFIGGIHLLQVAGAEICMYGGMKMDLLAGVGFEAGPEVMHLHLSHMRLSATKDDIDGMKTEIAAMRSGAHGLDDLNAGLAQLTAGMHDVEAGMSNLDAGLHVVAAGLISLM